MSTNYTVIHAFDIIELEKEIENFKQDYNILEIRYYFKKLRRLNPVYYALIKY